MGSVQSSTAVDQLVTPFKPYDEQKGRRSSGRRSKRGKQNQSSLTTLMQLTLLQDWQRVLIRIQLFPKEVSQECIVTLYGVSWHVLPLTLACALQPPEAVIESLLAVHTGAAMTPCVPYQRSSKTKTSRWTRAKVADEKSGITSISVSFGESSSLSSSTSAYSSTSLWSRHGRFSKNHKNYYVSNRSLVSLEESIGDVCSLEDFEEVRDDNEDDEDNHFNKISDGVILQLTTSGGVMSLPLNTRDNSNWEPDSSGKERSFALDSEELLQAIVAGQEGVLPIHVACLYKASAGVLKLLLNAHPMGSSAPLLGKLPIHWVAVGGHVHKPVVPRCSPPGIFDRLDIDTATEEGSCWTLSSLDVLLIAAPESISRKSTCDDLLASDYLAHNPQLRESPQEMDACRAILKKSSSHLFESLRDEPSLSKDEDDGSLASGNSLGTVSCMTESTSYRHDPSPFWQALLSQDWNRTMCLLEADSWWAREWWCTSAEVGGRRGHASTEHCTIAANPGSMLNRLPLHQVCGMIVPEFVVERLIESFPLALELADGQGRLPIHVACGGHGDGEHALQLIRCLLRFRPDTSKSIDQDGRCPLHVAIQSRASYAILEFLIHHDPTSVLCRYQGQSALSLARSVFPANSPVLGLLELVWM